MIKVAAKNGLRPKSSSSLSLMSQTKILIALYWSGKEQTAKELARDTGLELKQVYMAVHFLQQRRYVSKRRIETHWEKGVYVPPKIFVKLKYCLYICIL